MLQEDRQCLSLSASVVFGEASEQCRVLVLSVPRAMLRNYAFFAERPVSPSADTHLANEDKRWMGVPVVVVSTNEHGCL